MSKPRRKHPSARDRQRARQAVARTSRTAAVYPLFAARPPYRGYEKWMTPTTGATPPTDMPADAATVLDIVTAIAPLYHGQVPYAAIVLEQQIRAGVLGIAAEDGDGVIPVPVPTMATVLADTSGYADILPVPDDAAGEDVGELLHQLHALAVLVVDDQARIRLVALA